MAKIVVILLFLALCFVQAWLLQFDYWIRVDENYAIINDMYNKGNSKLQFNKPSGIDFPSISGVTAYGQSDGRIFGKTKTGFFLANEMGDVKEFSSVWAWETACAAQRVQCGAVPLHRISRFQDRMILKVQIFLAAGFALLFACVWVVRWRGPNTGRWPQYN